MKTLASYTHFFREIAENNKAINGFYRTHFTGDPFGDHLNLQEVSNALKNIALPCLLLEAYDMGFVDNDSDNILQGCKGAFWLLKKAKFNDFDEVEAVMSEMEVEAKRIIAYMKEYFLQNEMPGLDLQFRNFSIERCGPVFDQLSGARIDFVYHYSVNSELIYTPAMDQYWNTPPDES